MYRRNTVTPSALQTVTEALPRLLVRVSERIEFFQAVAVPDVHPRVVMETPATRR